MSNPTASRTLDGSLLSCLSLTATPEGSVREGDPTLYSVSDSESTRPWTPDTTPVVASPHSTQERWKLSHTPEGLSAHKKCRRLPKIFYLLQDSGSEDEEDSYGMHFRLCRRAARRMRHRIVEEEDSDEEIVSEITGGKGSIRREGRNSAAASPVGKDFVWSDDFTSFTGQKESYLRVPGPNFSSQDPELIFSKIWDLAFMEMVVSETNKYARWTIGQLSDPDIGTSIPSYLESWTDVTVEELYRFFAVLILISSIYRPKIQYYWDTGILEMSEFRKIISFNRYLQINKFLHFVDNEKLLSRGYARKIEKISPVVDHCNKKFAELYTPSQHLNLDESLLLWKGRLSRSQCIRSKAARFGIKSLELCEAETGYMLQYRLYTAKGTDMQSDSLHGIRSHTAKVVLDLMEGHLDVGHVLVMDNWYHQLPLARYLKSRRTDVLGTLNRRRAGIPHDIKDLMPNQVQSGRSVSRHNGDIALVAWKDVKLVTVMSTYHQHEVVTGKPVAVQEYNRYIGGVDLMYQKLSRKLIERKRNYKWYLRVFKRLLHISLLNAFIIYSRNPMYQLYSEHDFRRKVAEGLLSRYPRASSMPLTVSNIIEERPLRLQQGKHFPMDIETASAILKAENKQLRCVRCNAQKKRWDIVTMCTLCMVPLCIPCWENYHTVLNL